MVLALDVGHNALKTTRILDVSTVSIAIANSELKVVAVQHSLFDALGQLYPRCIQREVEVIGKAFEEIAEVSVKPLARLSPGSNSTLVDAEFFISDYHRRIHRHGEPKPRAGWTGPKG